MTEIAIIGSDIQEIIGSAIAIHILSGVSLQIGAAITIVDTFTFMLFAYFGIRKLEAFFAFLLGTMAVSFTVNFLQSHPDWSDVLKGQIIPIVKSENLLAQAIGIVGGVIMPHNLYLHSRLVLSRKINVKSYKKTADAINYNAIESAVSLFISYVINLSIIGTFAYYAINKSPGSVDLDLYNAGSAIAKTFGHNAKYV